MEKEFIPYEQALALKELGFDEKCFATWIERDIRDGGGIVLEMWGDEDTEYTPMSMLIAPLYQQAFRWFREKYKISGEISSDYYLEGKDNEWEYNIYQLGKEDDGYVGTIPIFKTPEEAELECLKKLIEIVKEEKL
jgi:hypothetical protein